MRRTWLLVACAAVLSGSTARLAVAQAPPYVPVQGFLTDSSGTAIDGTVSIRFRIYTTETGGTVLWEETQPAVNVQAGQLSAYLGDVEALDLGLFSTNSLVWVGIKVGDDEEATPRLQLGTVPFAGFAEACGDASTLNGMGAEEFLAADASIPWSSVTGAPPSPTWSTLEGKPSSFAPSGHRHLWSEIDQVPSALGTLGALSCSDSEVATWNGGDWTCSINGNGDITAIAGGTGINVSGGESGTATVNLDRSTVESYATGVALPLSGGTVTGPVTVQDSVRADEYRFRNARTQYVRVAGAVFNDQDANSLNNRTNFGSLHFGPESPLNDQIFAVAPVQLPAGATITAFGCGWRQESSDFAATCTLHRVAEGTSVTLSDLPLGDSTGSNVRADDTSLSELVSSEAAYMISVYMLNATGGGTGDGDGPRFMLNDCYVRLSVPSL